MKIVLVLVLALLFISSSAIAIPAKKSENNDMDKLSVHLKTDILKRGVPDYQNYGKVELKLAEIKEDDYSVKMMLDLKHASIDTKYDVYLWANIPNIPVTIMGELSNKIWYALESLFILNGYDLDGTLNGKIESSLGVLEISGYHVRDTFFDVETKQNGNIKYLFHERMTGEELIGSVVDFTWPYVRLHMIGLLPASAPYLPVEPDFSMTGITTIKLHGGTYPVSTGLIFISNIDAYYTAPMNFVISTSDIII
jgi:hypothetical protein